MIDGFTQALAAVDKLLDQARAEVARLERRVKINAEQPSREAHGVPMASASTAVEEQFALFVARGQVAALNSAWAAVARRERKTTERADTALKFPSDVDTDAVTPDQFRTAFDAAYPGVRENSIAGARLREAAALTFDERVEASRAKYAREQVPMVCELCKEPITEGQAHRAGQVHWGCYEKALNQ